MLTKRNTNGFTIVELLIVVVVIAILAAITIVSFNGVQARAKYSVMQQDVTTINKAILSFYAEKGYYPSASANSGNTGTNLNSIESQLVPAYISKLPTFAGSAAEGYYVYIWGDNGVSYKILRLVPQTSTLPTLEQSNPRLDPQRTTRGWGYWSANGNAL